MKKLIAMAAASSDRAQSVWYGSLVAVDLFCERNERVIGKTLSGLQFIAVGALVMGQSHLALADTSFNGYTGGGNTVATFLAGLKNNIFIPALEYGTYAAYACGVAAVGSALFDGWALTKGRAGGDTTVGKALTKGVLIGPGLGVLGILANTGAETLKQSAGA